MTASPAVGAPMGRVYVARHGQSTWNLERRWAGHADPPLTSRGREQARQAAERLASMGFARVVSSTLSRARETAAIIAAALDLELLPPNPGLDERHAGSFCGLTWEEINATYPHVEAQWRRGEPLEIPGGEVWSVFSARVHRALWSIVADAEAPVLAVAHAGVLRAISDRNGAPGAVFRNLEGTWVDLSTWYEAGDDPGSDLSP